ncbi:MAG TPA: choice-of-anchor G family protein [Jatrophihabitans sp.]|jgi:hypothetical protein
MLAEQRRRRSRTVRAVTAATVLTVAAGSALLCTAAPASASAVNAQAVGRFLDGSLGGKPLQQVVDLHDARATYPGTTSAQNPLDVTLFGQADVPLSGKLQAPGNNVFHAGVANQIAIARANGHALGAAGAVANQGGAALGGQHGYPSDATLNLSAAAFPSTPLPIPGAGGAAALGGLTATIGAVSARAATPAGFGHGATTHYGIAGLKLTLASPALAGVLKQLADALDTPAPPSSPLPVPKEPTACKFKGQALAPISIASGAISIEPTTGALTIDVAALLHVLGADLNNLPANTDLLAYVTNYLANGFGAGLQKALVHSFADQKQNFADCLTALSKNFPPQLQDAVAQLMAAVQQGQDQLTAALHQVTSKLGGGTNPFQPLVDGLKQALQVGVNVQPTGVPGTYRSPLRATPDQATPAVAGQTVVRALEIDLGGGQISLALANAAAGPSNAPAAPPAPQPTPAVVKHNHIVPTGVPAGQGPIGGGGPDRPLVLLVIGLALALAGGAVYRFRPRGH